MTDQTPVEAESLVDEPDSTDEVETPEADNGNSREARYRVRAKTAETALAEAQASIEQLQRRDIERIAGESLSAPVDFWLLSGNDVSAYLTEGCLVDAERVREDAALLLQERPGLSKRQPAVDPTQGSGSNPPKAQPSWSVLLKD